MSRKFHNYFCAGFFSAVFLTTASIAYAQTMEEMMMNLQKVEQRLSQVEKKLDTVLANQQKILQELSNVKVWVRRN